ncbi:MAG: Ldh family oxidoreductase, partial [Gemmataceae bacterium]|nr:Ldh family oxidoreductase [Gemmataceae bacterium]
MTFTADQLAAFAAAMFRALGLPDDDARIVARSLADANLAGHDSHGIIRVPQYAQAIEAGVLRGGVPLKIRSETPAVAVCDGGWGVGQVQAHRLLDLVMPKARALGLAAGTLFQCGHIGRLGEYGERAGREGLALIATVNNHGFGRAVAPPGGTVGRIGTNPLCLAVPAPEGPV